MILSFLLQYIDHQYMTRCFLTLVISWRDEQVLTFLSLQMKLKVELESKLYLQWQPDYISYTRLRFVINEIGHTHFDEVNTRVSALFQSIEHFWIHSCLFIVSVLRAGAQDGL